MRAGNFTDEVAAIEISAGARMAPNYDAVRSYSSYSSYSSLTLRLSFLVPAKPWIRVYVCMCLCMCVCVRARVRVYVLACYLGVSCITPAKVTF